MFSWFRRDKRKADDNREWISVPVVDVIRELDADKYPGAKNDIATARAMEKWPMILKRINAADPADRGAIACALLTQAKAARY